MKKMRAKMRIVGVTPHKDDSGVVVSESVQFVGVSRSDAYPPDGSDENNTFAKFSPSVNLQITIANPALLGVYALDQTFYVDFTPVDR